MRDACDTVSAMNAALVYPRLSAEELSVRWRELLVKPGLPERFELDEYGELIEMNPPRTPHQRIVRAMLLQIEAQLGGEALPGIGVLTSIGVRIPDVAWQQQWSGEDPVSPAPVLCVEVLSPDNTRREVAEKTTAYLAAGAQEVVIVELSGRIRHFAADGQMKGCFQAFRVAHHFFDFGDVIVIDALGDQILGIGIGCNLPRMDEQHIAAQFRVVFLRAFRRCVKIETHICAPRGNTSARGAGGLFFRLCCHIGLS